MPFGVQRGWQRYALAPSGNPLVPARHDTSSIPSCSMQRVIAPDASGPYMNRRYLVAGTVLSKRPDNTYERVHQFGNWRYTDCR
jgi:hypothetical protein